MYSDRETEVKAKGVTRCPTLPYSERHHEVYLNLITQSHLRLHLEVLLEQAGSYMFTFLFSFDSVTG